jgi:hypothetical protein
MVAFSKGSLRSQGLSFPAVANIGKKSTAMTVKTALTRIMISPFNIADCFGL